MEFIKVEPNTDGEIQPTFFLSEVKEEDNCLTVMRAEGVHSLQLINLGCDSNNAIYELASVCEVTEDGQPVTVTFPPIKTETQGDGNMIVGGWDSEEHNRVEQLVTQLGGGPEGISSARSVDFQQGYLIQDLRSGDGEDLISQPDGASKGHSAKPDSNIDGQQDYVTCDVCNGDGDEPGNNVPEGRSSAKPDSKVDCQQEYVTCDVCNGSGYLMHGLPFRKVRLS